MLDPNRKIGGSVIPKLLGMSKWGTPLDVYNELRGEGPPPTEATEDQSRGKFLEPALLDWARNKTQIPFVKPDKTVIYPDWPWATYSPDGITSGPTGADTLLEIKAPRVDDVFEWGHPGTDEVPPEYLVQCMWGLMVTGREKCIVAALLGGELRLFEVLRAPKFEAQLLERAKAFVRDHVESGVPPEPTYGDDANILRRYPNDTQPPKAFSQLSKGQQRIVTEYVTAYRAESAALKVLETYEPALKDVVGDAAGILCDDPSLPLEAVFRRIDWKRNKPSLGVGGYTAIAKELLARLPPEEVAAITEKYMPKEGPRVLRPYFAKEKP